MMSVRSGPPYDEPDRVSRAFVCLLPARRGVLIQFRRIKVVFVGWPYRPIV
jgi:hypothetical protein